MKGEKTKTLFVLVVFCLMGCVSTVEQHNSSQDNNTQTICPEPRPQVCTMDYRPVCAQRKDGSFKTYSNWCNACSDRSVIGYFEGDCKE